MTIDWWTLGLQTINILILIWLLGRFFWQPVAAMIEQRRAAAQQALAAAEAKDAEASAALAEIASTRAGFAKEREAILAAAREAAEREHSARLGQAEAETAALQAAAATQLGKDKHAAERAWVDRAGRLAVEIAARLLGRLDGPALRHAFLDRLLREIRTLPAAERLAVAPTGAALDAVSAEPLDAAEQAQASTAVAEALQTSPAINFKVDPALIAGLELRGPHVIVSNSLHADLDRILLELTHDERR
jgi:F-type H+-transporting ATPase subunit b